MKHYIAIAVLVPVAFATAFALGRVEPSGNDLATPVLISGLWVAGAIGLAGLVIWAVRDLSAKRRGDDAADAADG